MDQEARAGGEPPMMIGERPVELRLAELNAQLLRITILELSSDGSVEDPRPSPELVVTEAGRSIATIRTYPARKASPSGPTACWFRQTR